MSDNKTPTPLTDELWLDDEWIQAWTTHTFGSKSECWEYETLWDYLQAKLTSKYGNPTRIADLERQLAEARKDTERLDWLDANREVIDQAMNGGE